MQPPFPCPTAAWHNDSYESISPRRSELNASGKTIIIIGAGSGIGRATAIAFAEAGATHIVLLGRTESSLQETAKLVASAGQTTTSVHAADVTKAKSLEEVAASVGKWNVLVLSSGYVATPSSLLEAEFDDWWQGFETNVKGTLLAVRSFLPTADSQAAIIGLTTGVTPFPAAHLPGLSSYSGSKLAQAKVLEYVTAEHSNIFCANVHPGMIESDIFYKTGATPEKLPMDKVQLPAHFIVWLASPEATFLTGRTVWANWDVDELKTQKQGILDGVSMITGCNGWPYSPQH